MNYSRANYLRNDFVDHGISAEKQLAARFIAKSGVCSVIIIEILAKVSAAGPLLSETFSKCSRSG